MPEDAVIAYADGARALEEGRLQQARDRLSHAVLAAPGFALAHIALADAFNALGLRDLALSQARRGLQSTTRGDATTERLVRARLLELSRDHLAASREWRALVQTQPASIPWRLRLAEALELADRPGDARRTLDTLDPRTLSPFWHHAWLLTDARVHLLDNRNESARASFARSIDVARTHGLKDEAAASMLSLAMLHYRLGDLPAARREARRAEAGFAGTENRRQLFQARQARIGMDIVDGAEVPWRDVDALQRLAAASGNVYAQGQAAMVEGNCHMARGNGANAVEAWTRAVALFERIGDRRGRQSSQTQLVTVLRGQGRFEQANAVVAALAADRDGSAIDASRFDIDAAMTHAANGAWAQADAAYTRALAQPGADDNAWVGVIFCERGWVRAARGLKADARGDFDRCLSRAAATADDATDWQRAQELRARTGQLWLDAPGLPDAVRAQRVRLLLADINATTGNAFVEVRVGALPLLIAHLPADEASRVVATVRNDPHMRGWAYAAAYAAAAHCQVDAAPTRDAACHQARALNAADWRLRTWLDVLEAHRNRAPSAREAARERVARRGDAVLARMTARLSASPATARTAPSRSVRSTPAG